ncbi:MAG: STAS domain-containing protein [Acidiferrobacteraceae bacterium]
MSELAQAGGAGVFHIAGDITFDTVASVVDRSGQWSGAPQASVDLSGVGATDSFAVALLLDWANEARASGQALRIDGVPERLRDLIRVHGVAPLLDGIVAR